MTALPASFIRPAWALLALLGASAAPAAVEVEFASVEAAREVLGARDAYVERMSPFDRSARLKAEREVSEAEYLEFVEQAAREWTDGERARVAAAFEAIEPALAALLPELDEPILLIRTSGEEEAGEGYTRDRAVVVPAAGLERSDRGLARLLAHEIFHVVSRSRPALRDALYEAIGFHRCGEVALPGALAARRITNPDAPVNEHCIRVRVDGEPVLAVPVLYSSEPRYDPGTGDELFDYLIFAMLLVERSGDEGRARPIEREDGPALVPVERVDGFFEQVGRNTDYIIHPEEILASNFELLVLDDEPVPSPDVLERIRDVLAAAQD